jgi:very-short-patch-repair endonuclease
VASLATAQHGVVARRQLVELGIGPGAIAHRIATQRLHRLYAGVYAVGHLRLGREGRWLAAVLACGPESVLSHRSAAELWGLLGPSRGAPDVTTPKRTRTGVEPIRLHRARRLDPAEVTVESGIPVTSVARTLVDLAEVLAPDRLGRAVHEAEHLRLLDLRAVDAALGRVPGRQRAGALRRELEQRRPVSTIRSELERRFLDLCRAGDLPEPEMNSHLEVDGQLIEVDALWRDQGLVVELDGRAAHATARAFEADRARDAALTARGMRVVRLTWRRIAHEPGEVLGLLRTLLRGSTPRTI